jgi:hypothetical protein
MDPPPVVVPAIWSPLAVAFTLHMLAVDGKLGVIDIDTVDPVTVPAIVPLPDVLPYVPVNDEPDCEIVTTIAHESIKLGGHNVPPQLPATSAVDGAAGVEPQFVEPAAMTARTNAAIKRCTTTILGLDPATTERSERSKKGQSN